MDKQKLKEQCEIAKLALEEVRGLLSELGSKHQIEIDNFQDIIYQLDDLTVDY